MRQPENENAKSKGPLYVEREINLSLINSKLNEITALLYKLAEKNKVELEDDDDDL